MSLWLTQWLPAIVIFIYLAIVLYIGIFAFRRGKETGEDFFLASRSVGGIVFFLSLFAGRGKRNTRGGRMPTRA